MVHRNLPPIDYAALHEEISIGRVLELINFRAMRHRDPQVRGYCPLAGCRSTSPRDFSVHLTRGLYHCFACHSGGDQIALWAAYRQLSLGAAAVDLCRAVGIPVPRRHPATPRNRPQGPNASHPATS